MFNRLNKSIQSFGTIKGYIFISLSGLVLFFYACDVKSVHNKNRLLVYTTDLVNDSILIHQYDSFHSVKVIWPELKKANQSSGIEDVMIYRFGNRLMMMVTVPADADMRKMDSLYVNADNKVKIWGTIMNGFQRALPGQDTTKKWVEMKLIHHYKNGENVE